MRGGLRRVLSSTRRFALAAIGVIGAGGSGASQDFAAERARMLAEIESAYS